MLNSLLDQIRLVYFIWSLLSCMPYHVVNLYWDISRRDYTNTLYHSLCWQGCVRWPYLVPLLWARRDREHYTFGSQPCEQTVTSFCILILSWSCYHILSATSIRILQKDHGHYKKSHSKIGTTQVISQLNERPDYCLFMDNFINKYILSHARCDETILLTQRSQSAKKIYHVLAR